MVRYFEKENGAKICCSCTVTMVSIPVGDLQSAVLESLKKYGDVPEEETWESFHAWYMEKWSPGRGVPADSKEIWPILLDREHVIWDGWHRFNQYVARGMETIPGILIKGA